MTHIPISSVCNVDITWLKWNIDGELSAFDLQLVLGRLAQVDQHVAAIWENNLDLEPCPSIS